MYNVGLVYLLMSDTTSEFRRNPRTYIHVLHSPKYPCHIKALPLKPTMVYSHTDMMNHSRHT